MAAPKAEQAEKSTTLLGSVTEGRTQDKLLTPTLTKQVNLGVTASWRRD